MQHYLILAYNWWWCGRWWWCWWWIVLVGPVSEILTIANLRHAASRFLTYAESEFRLCWIKLWITATPRRNVIAFKYGKIETRKNSLIELFLQSEYLWNQIVSQRLWNRELSNIRRFFVGWWNLFTNNLKVLK